MAISNLSQSWRQLRPDMFSKNVQFLFSGRVPIQSGEILMSNCLREPSLALLQHYYGLATEAHDIITAATPRPTVNGVVVISHAGVISIAIAVRSSCSQGTHVNVPCLAEAHNVERASELEGE